MNEKLDRRKRTQHEFAGSQGVETGLFGEPLPSTARSRTTSKSRRLKPLPAPIRSFDADAAPWSTPGLAIRSLPVSALGVVGVCPRKYYWTYVLPLPRRRSPTAEFGTAVHAWIESGGSDETPIRSEFSAVAKKDFGEGSPTTESIAGRVQRNFLESRFGSSTPVLREAAFSFKPKVSPQTVVLAGRMDAVYQHDDGTIEIVDFKTGRAPQGSDMAATTKLIEGFDQNDVAATAKDANVERADRFKLPIDTEIQMAAYGLLALEAWGVTVGQLRTTVCYLGGNEPVLDTTVWNEQTAQHAQNLVGAHITKALSGASGVIPGLACSYCDFRAFCEGAAQALPIRLAGR